MMYVIYFEKQCNPLKIGELKSLSSKCDYQLNKERTDISEIYMLMQAQWDQW